MLFIRLNPSPPFMGWGAGVTVTLSGLARSRQEIVLLLVKGTRITDLVCVNLVWLEVSLSLLDYLAYRRLAKDNVRLEGFRGRLKISTVTVDLKSQPLPSTG
jgi:hypothetical protein